MHETREKPIRFGIMCDGKTLRHWQAQCVRRILDLDKVSLALLILEPAGRRGIKKARFSHLFLQAYRNLFVKPPALRPTNMTSSFSNIPTIECKTIGRGRFSE